MHLTVKRFQLFYCFYYKTIKSKYHIWTCFFLFIYFFISVHFIREHPKRQKMFDDRRLYFSASFPWLPFFLPKLQIWYLQHDENMSLIFFFLFECSKAGGRRFQKFQVTDTRRAVFRFLLWKWCWNLTADSTLDGESDTGWSMTFLETTKNPCSGDPLII